ncbi:glycosyl transferase family 1 [Flavobacterium rivuli WB 3.3-2 = DSM 21788]|uniref:Glycosyl transferase family 1 n=1 Tax=Flavobacterium rivuli WB 3.3-2 = DSM 21788 TaxID=1121895 RepID=A0A0A2MGK0_9FLAO|nr:glycosyltransferase family 4 protein [Flavobacterium rivuli]KGO87440.1 glycosyl transferase family 1 [Flavobacterium rivuli WB 3.3-2 = DSM 21788]
MDHNDKIILSHPLGNQNVRAALKGFNDTGQLAAFNTSIACFPDTLLDSLSNLKPLKEIKKRKFDAALSSITHVSPVKEVGRLLSLKAGFKSLTKHEAGVFSIDKVSHDVDNFTAKMLLKNKIGANAVYAYEDAALETFKMAGSIGIPALYDLPIGYWRAARRLMQSEVETRPEWASTMLGFKDSQEKLQRKDDEIFHAKHIFVASSFTAKTLLDYPGVLPKISVIPYGFPPVYKIKTYNDTNKPLKVLFVGGLSQRKGIANLFEAVNHFGVKNIELTVVGRRAVTDCSALEAELAKCNYIPSLPHNEILALMQTQDVFVFPSLFEGFGLVITEAMSQGLPVITTDRTVGPDIITHSENGWIINAGSTNSLIECLENILSDRSLLKKCGVEATNTASLRSWDNYGLELAQGVHAVLNNNFNR